jgi:hypothetical protein
VGLRGAMNGTTLPLHGSAQSWELCIRLAVEARENVRGRESDSFPPLIVERIICASAITQIVYPALSLETKRNTRYTITIRRQKMRSIKKIITASACTLLLSLASVDVMAAATIQFDSLTYHVGTVLEGSLDSVEHVFVFKNTGTDTLKIEHVKPG